jgi:hypothetical protein
MLAVPDSEHGEPPLPPLPPHQLMPVHAQRHLRSDATLRAQGRGDGDGTRQAKRGCPQQRRFRVKVCPGCLLRLDPMGIFTSWTVSSAGAHVHHSTSKNDAVHSPPPGERIPATHSPDSGEERPSSCRTALAYSSSADRAGIVSAGRESAMHSKHIECRQPSIAQESASPTTVSF